MNVFKLKLHQTKSIGDNEVISHRLLVTRVPGGLLYRDVYSGHPQFVPVEDGDFKHGY